MCHSFHCLRYQMAAMRAKRFTQTLIEGCRVCNRQRMAAMPFRNRFRATLRNFCFAGDQSRPLPHRRLHIFFHRWRCKYVDRLRNIDAQFASNFAGQARCRGELAANHGNQACGAFTRMVMQNVSAGHG